MRGTVVGNNPLLTLGIGKGLKLCLKERRNETVIMSKNDGEYSLTILYAPGHMKLCEGHLYVHLIW